jgi:polyisoprenoid-binding protein YceI
MTRNHRNERKWCTNLAGFGVLMLASLSPAAAQQTEIKFDRAKTRIEWTLGDVLHTVQGMFQLKSGAIQFDPRNGEASGELIVDAASGDSGNKTRDSKMKKEVLETDRYPEITFVPKHVSGFVAGQETSTVQVAGIFTIHGSSHELTLTVPVTLKSSTVEAHTSFSVPYDAWGMKNPSTLFLMVDKEVKISITAVGDLGPQVAARSDH